MSSPVCAAPVVNRYPPLVDTNLTSYQELYDVFPNPQLLLSLSVSYYKW